EGGMTNGEVLRVRAAMKPISTVPRALATVDVATGEPAVAINQRSDVCAVPAAGVVAEAMVALVIADAVLEKFGGDAVTETARNARSYLDGLGSTIRHESAPASAAKADVAQGMPSPSGPVGPSPSAPSPSGPVGPSPSAPSPSPHAC
ncbi:MAG TPA: chorismate synthase, partial [Nakamurella sp.]|nr:chorismate synthase [Nakamurella sp.]